MTAKEIKTETSLDGLRMLTIFESDNGLFQFCEYVLTYEDASPYNEAFSHLLPSQMSGYYSSAEDAEADARARLLWLAQKSN